MPNQNKTKKRALVALSGGVDSSVAAYLVQRAGYAAEAVTMRLYTNTPADAGCTKEKDLEDARRVAALLSIPYEVQEFSADFQDAVIRPFVTAYEEGYTPNPCIDCNRRLKFGALVKEAEARGCDILVTGHYARITEEADGRFLLRKARNLAKDQSYVLYAMTEEERKRTRFPLGEFASKDEVRALADEMGLPTAGKEDSQDICFVPDGDYAAFIERYTGKSYPAGDFVTEDGQVLGRHKGIIRYTLGQRKGLSLSLPQPLYVLKKDAASNTVTLAPEAALYTDFCYADGFNWIAVAPPKTEISVTAKTRYRAKEVPCTARATEDGRVYIRFLRPERAVTPGQAIVLYDGDIVVGGGRIQ